MYEELINIGVKILAALVAAAITWIGVKARGLIAARVGESDMAQLDSLIKQFCAAAEQQLKADDPTGANRMEYVKALLVEAGYEVSEIVLAKIEAEVWSINLLNAGKANGDS